MDPLVLWTLIVGVITLIVVVVQTWLVKRSLDASVMSVVAAQKSIDDSRTQRQLAALPEMHLVLEVQTALEMWRKDLAKLAASLEAALAGHDKNLIAQLASSARIKSVKDLGLSDSLRALLPVWLRTLWMSGAQHYYAAAGITHSLIDKNGQSSFPLAKAALEACSDSTHAIDSLIGMISDMIPEVILETPASISDRDFFDVDQNV
jgi:hypothetical protein